MVGMGPLNPRKIKAQVFDIYICRFSILKQLNHISTWVKVAFWGWKSLGLPSDAINLLYLYKISHLHQSYLIEPSIRTPETEGAQSKFAKFKLYFLIQMQTLSAVKSY